VQARHASPAPDLHRVVAHRLVLLEHGVVLECAHVPGLAVDLAVHLPHQDDLGIGKVAELQFVDIWQLVAFAVHRPVVRVALADQDLVTEHVGVHPAICGWPLWEQVGVQLVAQHLGPVIPRLARRQHLVDLGLVAIGGMERLGVVGRHGIAQTVHEGTSVVEESVWLGELVLDGKVIRRRERAGDDLPVHDAAPRLGRRLCVLGVQDQVLVPEAKVLGRHRRAIRPFHAFAQVEGPLRGVGIHFPGLAQPGVHLHVLVDLQEGALDDLGPRGTVSLALLSQPPAAAVLADAVQPGDDEGVLGQALLHGGQLALGDLLGQHGGLLVARGGRGRSRLRRWRCRRLGGRSGRRLGRGCGRRLGCRSGRLPAGRGDCAGAHQRGHADKVTTRDLVHFAPSSRRRTHCGAARARRDRVARRTESRSISRCSPPGRVLQAWHGRFTATRTDSTPGRRFARLSTARKR